jgi:Tol biopolymer transport system component
MRWRVRASVVVALTASSAPDLGAQHSHGGVTYHAPRWSPDGQWILASANRDGDTEIYLVRADGGALRQLTRNEVPDDLARWSDDGRRILFVSGEHGRETQFSMAPDGTGVRAEPRDSVIARSSDGRLLLFEAVREGRGRLFSMRADRTGAKAISGERHAEQGSFSPDGARIVYEERDATHEGIERSQVVVASADGTSPKAVASGTDPSWSPDGRLLLFKTFDAKTNQLWVATTSPDGGVVRTLAPGVHPQWSPDGRRIVFMRHRDDGGADIWVIDRDGADARCVTCGRLFR